MRYSSSTAASFMDGDDELPLLPLRGTDAEVEDRVPVRCHGRCRFGPKCALAALAAAIVLAIVSALLIVPLVNDDQPPSWSQYARMALGFVCLCASAWSLMIGAVACRDACVTCTDAVHDATPPRRRRRQETAC